MPASCSGADFMLTKKFGAANTQIISTAPRVSGLLPQNAPAITAAQHTPSFCFVFWPLCDAASGGQTASCST